MPEEKPAKTEGDNLTTNSPGIIIFGKDHKDVLEAIRVSKLTNDQLFDVLSQLVTEMKITNKHLSCITNETFTAGDLDL